MITSLLILLYFFLFTVFLSSFLIKIVRQIAFKWNIVAYPREDRHSKKATPLLGGVAIFGAFYITIIFHSSIYYLFGDWINATFSAIEPFLKGGERNMIRLIIILLLGFLIFMLGLIDDIRALGPKRKFFFQIFMGLILYKNGISITAFGDSQVLSILLTVFWVAAITNAFNLLDNIDGLAAGVAAIASIMLLLMCIQGGQVLISILLVIFIGSLLGFLKWNYPPASIFMGDCGSLFIGFMMSTLTMMSTFSYEASPGLVPIVAPLMILSVPIYDTLSVIFIRIRNKRSIFVGDKNHFSHRLLKVGMTNREAINFIYLVGCSTGMAALTLANAPLTSQIILLSQSILLIMLIHHLKGFKTERKDA